MYQKFCSMVCTYWRTYYYFHTSMHFMHYSSSGVSFLPMRIHAHVLLHLPFNNVRLHGIKYHIFHYIDLKGNADYSETLNIWRKEHRAWPQLKSSQKTKMGALRNIVIKKQYRRFYWRITEQNTIKQKVLVIF